MVVVGNLGEGYRHKKTWFFPENIRVFKAAQQCILSSPYFEATRCYIYYTPCEVWITHRVQIGRASFRLEPPPPKKPTTLVCGLSVLHTKGGVYQRRTAPHSALPVGHRHMVLGITPLVPWGYDGHVSSFDSRSAWRVVVVVVVDHHHHHSHISVSRRSARGHKYVCACVWECGVMCFVAAQLIQSDVGATNNEACQNFSSSNSNSSWCTGVK